MEAINRKKMANWFKIYETDLDDSKFQLLVDENPTVIPVWLWILTECAKNKNGVIDFKFQPKYFRMIGKKINQDSSHISEALNLLCQEGFILIEIDTITLSNWESRQSEFMRKQANRVSKSNLNLSQDKVRTKSGQSQDKRLTLSQLEERRGEEKREEKKRREKREESINTLSCAEAQACDFLDEKNFFEKNSDSEEKNFLQEQKTEIQTYSASNKVIVPPPLDFPCDSLTIQAPQNKKRCNHASSLQNASKSSGKMLAKIQEKTKTEGTEVFEAYSEAYLARYGVEPVRNAKINALCSQLVARLGKNNAIAIVQFYLTHEQKWYVQKGHALEYAVKDAESLHMQRLTNNRVSTRQANERDSARHSYDLAERLKARLAAQGETRWI